MESVAKHRKRIPKVQKTAPWPNGITLTRFGWCLWYVYILINMITQFLNNFIIYLSFLRKKWMDNGYLKSSMEDNEYFIVIFLSQWQATSDDQKTSSPIRLGCITRRWWPTSFTLSRKIGFQVLMSQFIIDGNSTSIYPFT